VGQARLALTSQETREIVVPSETLLHVPRFFVTISPAELARLQSAAPAGRRDEPDTQVANPIPSLSRSRHHDHDDDEDDDDMNTANITIANATRSQLTSSLSPTIARKSPSSGQSAPNISTFAATISMTF